MQTRGSKKIAPTDKVVSTATAKKEWFLSAAQLSQVAKTGGGAMWGAGRFPTFYSVKDLERVALKVHGAAGLAKKRAAREKRQANKDQKLKETQKKKPLHVVVDDECAPMRKRTRDGGTRKEAKRKKRGKAAPSSEELDDQKQHNLQAGSCAVHPQVLSVQSSQWVNGPLLTVLTAMRWSCGPKAAVWLERPLLLIAASR